jgi:DNA repair exonuclease SbcCD ATPase subunit
MPTFDNIFHLSDIHIRLNERHVEYQAVFNRTYKKIKKLKTKKSLIVLTGDIVHSKNKLTPQCIDITYNFIKNLSKICHVVLILGNHDTNLKNKEEIDSLQVIVRNIKNLSYLRESGSYIIDNITFGVSSLLDGDKNIIQASECDDNEYKIALYHGAVKGAKNSVGYKLSGISQSKFEGYDFTLLGDIHQFQYLNKEETMAYPSSLIQQNFGESVDNHGFIHWDLKNKNSTYHNIKNDYGFIKIVNTNINNIPHNIPPRATVKIETNENTDEYVRKFKKLYPDTTIIHVNKTVICENDEKDSIEISNMNVNTQNEIIKKYFSKKYNETQIEEIQKLNIKYNLKFENNIEIFSKWKLLNMTFSNMFSYGENQIIKFNNMNGVIGIFGPNHYGKSSIFDIILYCLFEKTSKTDKHSRINVINSMKDSMICVLNFKIGNDLYNIIRTGNVAKKFNVIFTKNKININGDSNRDTNKIIESIIGTYENFVSTCFSLQNNNDSFANLKQTDRKKYLYKMLRLDIYEDLYNNVIVGIKDKKNKLKNLKSMYGDMIDLDYHGEYQSYVDIYETSKQELVFLNENLIKLDVKIKNENIKLKDIPLLDNSIDISTLSEKIDEKYNNICEKNENINRIEKMTSLNKCKEKIKEYSEKNETHYKEIVKCDIEKTLIILKSYKSTIESKKNEKNKLSKSIINFDKDVILDTKVKIKELKNLLKKTKHKTHNIKDFETSKYYDFEYDENDYEKYKNKINILNKLNIEKKYIDKSIKENECKIKSLKNHEYNPDCTFCCKNNIVIEGDTSKNKLIKLKEEYESMCQKIDTINKYVENSQYFEFNLKDFRKIQMDKQIVEDVLLYAENLKEIKVLEKESRTHVKYEKQTDKITKLNAELEILYVKKDNIEDKIKSFEKSKKRNEKYIEKIEINNQKKEKYQEIVNEITTLTNRNIELDKNITYLSNSIVNVEKEIEHRKIHSKYSNENKKVKKIIEDFRDEYNILNEEKTTLISKIKDLKHNIDICSKNIKLIETNENEINNVENELSALTRYSEVIKKDGVPLQIVNETMPKIQNKINTILNNFVDFKLELIAIDKHIVINIVYDNSKWDVSGCSGFEKFIINIVFRIALQDITNVSRPNFIAIDEGWGCFDENNLQKVDIIFNIVKSYYEYILIITHIDKLKDNVDKHFTINRDVNNFSYIE